MIIVFVTASVFASPDGPTKFSNKNECLENLVDALGPDYKVINQDIIVKVNTNNMLTVYNSNAPTINLQKNSECSRDSNKMNDFNGLMLDALEKANLNKKFDIRPCESQHGDSSWFKIYKELGNNNKKSKKIKTQTQTKTKTQGVE